LRRVSLLFILFLCLSTASLFGFQEERNPVVWKLSFEGNESFRSMVLKQVIATDRPTVTQKLFRRHSGFEFNETEIRRDQVRLSATTKGAGFLM